MDLLEKMTTYVRVVEAGSFSAAAKQLRVSSAAVSRQIATLERDLSVTLLARSTRRMAVTDVGRRYYERCLRVLREVDDAQAVGRGDPFDGPLVVTSPVTFGIAFVAPHMHALMQRHPRLRVELRVEDRLVDLALEGVDVAVRVGAAPVDSADVVAQELASFRRVVVASPGYAKRKGEPKSLEALAKHAALAYPVMIGGDVWVLGDGEREARVRVSVAFRSNALHAIRELAIAGAGVALLPDWLVGDDVRSGALRRVLPAWRSEPVAVVALHRTSLRGEPRVRAFIDHLRAAYAAAARPGERAKA
jgi:DNA-binding transcriptional LysR family regulator